MRYSVLLSPIKEPGFSGYYYAHILALDLTTHGKGVEGALKAAQELADGWVLELQARDGGVPQEDGAITASIEVGGAVHST